MKLLPLEVYRGRHDCTNGGITSAHDTIYMVCPRGHCDSEEVAEELIFRGESLGNYHRLVPIKPTPEGMAGPMFGGNLAATSDGRAGGIAYHVHDRYETWEQFEYLSR